MNDRLHAFGKEEYSWLDTFIFSRRKRQIVERLPQALGVIADFGSGYDCRLLTELLIACPGARGVAVDTEFHPELCDDDRLELVEANLNQPLPTIADNSVDVGLSLAVLEHLDAPDVFLREAYRVLKPGGMLLLTTPGPTSKPLLEFLAFKLKVIDAHEIADHKHYFSSAELRTAFAEAGFLPEQIEAKTFIFGMNNVVKAVR